MNGAICDYYSTASSGSYDLYAYFLVLCTKYPTYSSRYRLHAVFSHAFPSIFLLTSPFALTYFFYINKMQQQTHYIMRSKWVQEKTLS